VGVVFLIPFIIFWVKGYFKKWMIHPLIILFLLGALQGAIGWIMVASGLNDTDLYVSHIKLAIHFISAMILICYALIFGLMLVVKPKQRVENDSLKKLLIALIVILTIQLLYGAFMAGLKAANAAPTWPTINGAFFPRVWGNIFHDTLTIHFIHRTLAYILAILVFWWWVKAKAIATSAAFFIARPWPLVLVIFQILLGIFSLITSPHKVVGHFGSFEWMAQLHQLVGMLLLLSLIAATYILKFKGSSKG
jgi:cytochrome c oxidase assembly protein subunit 15